MGYFNATLRRVKACRGAGFDRLPAEEIFMKLSIFSVQDHYPGRPRTVPQLYAEVINQAVLADTLGYEGFFSAEHHFHPYGVVPNPSVLLSAIAQRTQRVRLGTAISVLTFHDPRTLAETFAMVDVLTGGRFVLGVGSGYLKHEFEGYGVALEEKRDRFDECLRAVELLLTGERITFHGKYHHIDAVQLNVLPVQKPIPLYVAILRKEAAYHVGLQGKGLLWVPYASVERFDEIGPLIEEFRRGRSEAAEKASALPKALGDNIVCLHTHVAESDAEARRVASAAFDLYVETRLYAKRMTFDDVLRSGVCLFGGVDTVVDKLCALAGMGINHVMTLQNFGYLPAPEVEKSMRILIEQVMPKVRARLARKPLASVA
jgi:alkanesulfonate monooxygenase SsuD/methylene tetrahydromethanopterin reductase-like flavin-dependent oxidoreductase (luciferase family)